MPPEQDLEQANSDMDNAVDIHISSTPHWWPLKLPSASGSFKISVVTNLVLLLLCTAAR
jgi:hypothetical protein